MIESGIEFDMTEFAKLADKVPGSVIETSLELVGEVLSGNMVREAPVDHGRLSGNIGSPVKLEELTYGIPIDVNYWKPVQFGRKEIVPVNAKALRFEIKGQVVFAMRAAAVEPNPFIDRAVDRTEPRIPDLIDNIVGKVFP